MAFGALKSPGPSGLRPEHLGEMLSVRRRISNKLVDALALFTKVAQRGGLAQQARWITYSKTVMIGKKAGKTPRPIKVSELLRSIAARKNLNKAEGPIRRLLARNNQFGVAVSGGAEALTHFRSTVEETIKAGKGPVMVVADLDMKNFFGTVEWPSIENP